MTISNHPHPPAREELPILIVAGEVSGDMHAAKLVRHLRRICPKVSVFGMGGKALREAGAETVVDSETAASVMGVVEVAGRLFDIWRAYRLLLQESEKRRPALAILVDFPDFNLKLARVLHARGIRILYYISPQLWAWRRGRIRLIKRYVTKVIPIFPFEEEYYRSHGVEANYVGNPLLDEDEPTVSRNDYLPELGLDTDAPVLALLPGSRKGEVSRLLRPMAAAAQELRKKIPRLQAVLPVAKNLDIHWLQKQLPPDAGVLLVPGQSRLVLSAADAAVVASGTATLEAALARVPFVAVYKLAPLTYLVGKLLVRGVRHFAMPNLIAEESVVEELLQSDVTPGKIAAAVSPFLEDRQAGDRFREAIDRVRAKLTLPDAGGSSSERTARIVAQLLKDERH